MTIARALALVLAGIVAAATALPAQAQTYVVHGLTMGRPASDYGPVAQNEHRWQEVRSPGDPEAIAPGARYFVREPSQGGICEIISAAPIAPAGTAPEQVVATMDRLYKQTGRIVGDDMAFGRPAYDRRVQLTIEGWTAGTAMANSDTVLGTWTKSIEPMSKAIYYATVGLIEAPDKVLWARVVYIAANITSCRSAMELGAPKLF
jgi:hypothetical protein